MDAKLVFDDRAIDGLLPARLQQQMLPRREFMRLGTAAFAAGALLPLQKLAAQVAVKNAPQIDFHHHFGPPQWKSFLASKNVLHPSWKDWTPARSIEELDRAG